MNSQPLITINQNPSVLVSANKKLSLVVWNIFKGHKEHSWQHLSGLDSRSDFMAIQEMVFHPKTEYRFHTKHPETYWSMGTSFVYEDTGLHTGVAMASDYRVSDSIFISSLEKEPFTKTSKSAMIQTYPIDGHRQHLLIGHMHALNFTRFHKFKTQIDNFVQHIRDHEGPIVISGDFNTHLYPRKKYLISKMKELGLVLSKPERDRRPLAYTHVFVRDLTVRRHHYERSIHSSDHKPFIVEFTIK